MPDLWELDLFETRLDDWIGREHPPEWLQVHLLEWIPTRRINPRDGAHLEAGFENLWAIQVHGSSDGYRAVLCSYWILDTDRMVRCDNFGWLSLPII